MVLCALPALADPALAFMSFLSDGGQQHIALDANGNIYVAGITSSNAFPVTPGAFQPAYHPGTCYYGLKPGIPCSDIFVAKWNPSGTRLLWATYLGGTGDDMVQALAVDGDGNVYISGWTNSSDFPVTPGAFQTNYNGARFGSEYTLIGDAFIAKLTPSGSNLAYSTYLGGTASDLVNAMAVDSAGNVYLAGWTFSTDFPVSAGAMQSVNRDYSSTSPGASAFVAKLNAAGSALVYSTYLGGSTYDYAIGLAVDAAGTAYVAGATRSQDFPLTAGAFQSAPGDLFLARINPSGTGLLSSTYFGGKAEELSALALDSSGKIYLLGSVSAPELAVTPDALKTTLGGYCAKTGQGQPIYCPHGFIARFDASISKLEYATYLGGSTGARAEALLVDSQGYVYASGITGSLDFPVTPDAFQPCSRGAGTGSAFLVKFKPGSRLAYSTFLGGSAGAEISGLTIDGSGHLYLTGTAGEATVPIPAGPNTFVRIADFPPPPTPVVQLGAGEGGGTFVSMLDFSASAPVNRVSCIVNAADKRGGYIAHGEIVEIRGKGLGPDQEVAGQLTPYGTVSTSVAGVQVLFSGIAAPLISVQGTRIVAVVPNVTPWSQAEVTVVNSGSAVPVFPAVVVRTAPAVFTQDGSGYGQAAVLNEDGTVNSPTNPAAKGSVISIFCTGLGGQGYDGVINSGTLPPPDGKVGVSIDYYSAEVLYAGSAPGQVFGVYQVNVRVPPQAFSGAADWVSLYTDNSNLYGTSSGLFGATISVK